MKTNRILPLCRWTAIAALLAFTGCAAYPTGSDGYATGYYDGSIYDGLYGYDGFGVGDFGVHPYGDHGHHADGDYHHFAGSHDGFMHQHGALGGFQHGIGAPHGAFAHVGMAGHGGGGHGRA
jgi:hypothetical protein